MRSGVTEANLKEAGKIPSAKDRFASLAMIALKVTEQFFMVDVGIKSTGDDLVAFCQSLLELLPQSRATDSPMHDRYK